MRFADARPALPAGQPQQRSVVPASGDRGQPTWMRPTPNLSAAAGWRPISEGGPQLLPPSNGAVRAFKFRDPDGHPLELIWFPPGQGRAVWHAGATSGAVPGHRPQRARGRLDAAEPALLSRAGLAGERPIAQPRPRSGPAGRAGGRAGAGHRACARPRPPARGWNCSAISRRAGRPR